MGFLMLQYTAGNNSLAVATKFLIVDSFIATEDGSLYCSDSWPGQSWETQEERQQEQHFCQQEVLPSL